jgi:hypothetical protein
VYGRVVSSSIDRAGVEALLGRLHLDDEARLGERERKKATEVTALLRHLEPLLADAPRRRELLVLDAAAGRGHVAAAMTALLMPAMGLRARIVACEWEAGRAERSARRMAECGLHGIEVVTGAVQVLEPGGRPDLVVGLHACGEASDQVIELVLRTRARRLALVPCCHAASSELLERLELAVGGAAGDRLTAAATDAKRILRLEAARYRVHSVPLGRAAETGRDLLLLAREGGGVGRAQRAARQLRAWDTASQVM